MTDTASPQAPVPARTSNQLAVSRTIMAADRSLMAWIRTGLSMISFGFTIYKILQGFQASGGAAAMSHSPRAIGLFLAGLGTTAILMGTAEYGARLRQARTKMPLRIWRPSFFMAVVMSATGLFVFFGILARLL